jgi:hypothetical protein
LVTMSLNHALFEKQCEYCFLIEMPR